MSASRSHRPPHGGRPGTVLLEGTIELEATPEALGWWLTAMFPPAFPALDELGDRLAGAARLEAELEADDQALDDEVERLRRGGP